jgi:hypothetical protein
MNTISQILMVRPYQFLSNPETRESNAFQNPSTKGITEITALSLQEFDFMVQTLRDHKIKVMVFQDPGEVETPDSIFPNNWISFHDSGDIFLYPMMAPNRRLERRFEDISLIIKSQGFKFRRKIDLSYFELENKFLEGTGSMVLDRKNKICYACLSPRTNTEVVDEFCRESGYRSFIFNAFDENQRPIYHTNVLMCVGDKFVLACLDSIRDEKQKEGFQELVQSTKKQLIVISLNQMNHFAGNMLEVISADKVTWLIMSDQAQKSLSASQIKQLNQYVKILSIPIYTIEENGGGSVRCMMAEIPSEN